MARLFSETLRENMLLGADAGEAEIKAAVRAAVLEPDIAAMPAGLETAVGPRGVRRSGGKDGRVEAAGRLEELLERSEELRQLMRG